MTSNLSTFLQDAVVAMSEGASLINVSGIPEIGKLKSVLPAEIYLPITNFLSTIQKETASTPVPKLLLKSDDIDRLTEILTSDLCIPYRLAHEELDSTDIKINHALASVTQTGKALFNKAKDALDIKRNAMGILSFTPKVLI